MAATVASWGVWAVLAKVIGDRLTGAQSQALSTVGMVPVVLALVATLVDRFRATPGAVLLGTGSPPPNCSRASRTSERRTRTGQGRNPAPSL